MSVEMTPESLLQLISLGKEFVLTEEKKADYFITVFNRQIFLYDKNKHYEPSIEMN